MDTNLIKNIVRIGRVSSINAAANTVKVVFTDKNELVSGELMVVNRGSMADKDYWLPDIDEQVLCLMLPNNSGQGLNAGFVLGSFFSAEDEPQENSADVRAVKFGDGTVVKHDRSTGNLTINATGDISIIAGGAVTIRGNKVEIN
ncbi:phage baseplate assembly protein V [uncultured Phascolarctobacterium sp.]|uniref:phage baseplate assembly protein V n=1 Tax=uncultured Phascolarctobacterium sp. TaxID=512296 RepID=UPI0025F203FC|nr:phage baseplate assembly protein V [uncultured Phascolarctobacterium sp.]